MRSSPATGRGHSARTGSRCRRCGTACPTGTRGARPDRTRRGAPCPTSRRRRRGGSRRAPRPSRALRARVARELAVQPRRRAHLLVRHHRAVHVARQPLVRVGELVVEHDPRAHHRARDLHLEVLARHHHQHPAGGTVLEQRVGHPRREARLAGARGRDDQRVARPVGIQPSKPPAATRAAVTSSVQTRSRHGESVRLPGLRHPRNIAGRQRRAAAGV